METQAVYSHLSGTFTEVGGLVGRNEGTIIASYATASVEASRSVGGLVGTNVNDRGRIIASYATGTPEGGFASFSCGLAVMHPALQWGGTVTDSYFSNANTVGSFCAGTGQSPAGLQGPTTYTGIYANWNVDLDGDNVADDPWNFGTSSQYPTLRAHALAPAPPPVLSDDATLGALVVSTGTLTPAFDSGVTRYRANVAIGLTRLTVTATKANAAAAVRIEPADADSIMPGHQVALGVGDTVITVGVTAQDPAYVTTYAVTVVRDLLPSFGAAEAPLISLSLNVFNPPTFLPQASGGDGALSYRISPPLPAGVTHTAPTAIGGTPIAEHSTTTYVLTVSDEDGDTDTLTFELAVIVVPVVVDVSLGGPPGARRHLHRRRHDRGAGAL